MNKVFSKGIYKEALSSLRICGAILLGIALIVTVLTMISYYSDWQRMKEISPVEYEIYAPYSTHYSISGILPFYVFAAGFALPMCAFSFLNKRKTSDFYHALPYSRFALFFSTFAACATWVLIITASVIGVELLGCAITGLGMYYSLLPSVIGVSLVGTIFVCSVCSLAMSLTGNAFSNIILFGLILFLPRYALFIAGATVQELAVIIPTGELGVFLDCTYNIPVGLFLSLFDMYPSQNTVYSSAAPIIYTGVLLVLYTAAAAVLFSKRKSEVAGNSSQNRILQCVYRCATGLVAALLLPTLLLVSESPSTPQITTLVACSIVPFLLFELITTKSFKKMLRALPSYLIVVAITAVFAGAVHFGANAMLSKAPSQEDVDSIQIFKNESTLYGYQPESPSYMELKAQKVKLKNAALIDFATTALEENIENIKASKAISKPYYYITFYLKDGSSMTRKVYMDEGRYDTTFELMQADERYKEARNTLPTVSETERLFISQHGMSFTDKESEAIWKMLRSEYNYQADIITPVVAEAFCTGITDGQNFANLIPIHQGTPNTLKLLLETVAKHEQEGQNMKKALSVVRSVIDDYEKNGNSAEYGVKIEFVQPGINLSEGYNVLSAYTSIHELKASPDLHSPQKVKSLLTMIESFTPATEITDKTVMITVSNQSTPLPDYNIEYVKVLYNLTQEQYDSLRELLADWAQTEYIQPTDGPAY